MSRQRKYSINFARKLLNHILAYIMKNIKSLKERYLKDNETIDSRRVKGTPDLLNHTVSLPRKNNQINNQRFVE